jgi:hypothetical protein
MEEQRYQELLRKRDQAGLSDDEASELGRMIANRQGKPYRGPKDIDPDDAEPQEVTPVVREEATEREEAGEEPEPDPPEEEMEEDREAGMERRGAQRYY